MTGSTGRTEAQPWFTEAFGAFYAELYAHRDDREVDQLLSVLTPHLPKDAPILDLACGAGRLLRPLSERFPDAVGIDLSWELLQMVGARRVARADMRSLPLRPRAFGAVLSLFTSFGYFDHADVDRAVFRGMAELLRPGGLLVLDFLNADVVLAGLRPHSVDTIGDRHVESRRHFDAATRILEKQVEVRRGHDVEKRYRERVRVYDVEQLKELFVEQGLEIETIWGEYDGSAFTRSQSSRCLILGRRPLQ